VEKGWHKKNAPQQLLLTTLNLKLNSEQEKNRVEVSPKIAIIYNLLLYGWRQPTEPR
jgi:hypothetical protein